MIHKTRTKALSWLLSLALVLGLMPGMSLTALAYDDNPYASLVGTTTTVKFNNIDWYIIADDSTAVDAGTVTLLAKDPIGACKFNNATNDGNTYSNSEVKRYLDSLTDTEGSFETVADAITPVTLTINKYSSTTEVAEKIQNAKLWLLSTSEAQNLQDNIRKCSKAAEASNNYWWLCSPGNLNLSAACVCGDTGDVDVSGYIVSRTYGVRPALKLNLSSVIFSSETNKFLLKPVVTEYPLWVGDTQVTSANAGNIDGASKASYDASINTLTLNGYSYTGVGHKENSEPDSPLAAIYYTGTEPLTIQLSGTSSITRTGDSSGPGAATAYGIHCSQGNLTIDGNGSGSLTVTGGELKIAYGIVATTVTIKNANVTSMGKGSSSGTGIYGKQGISIQNATVNAEGKGYGISGDTGSAEIEESSSVTATGSSKAINGTVKNSIAGTGWTNKEGTEGEAAIAVSTEGQGLSAYKKVQFPAAHTHSFTYSVGTGENANTVTATCSNHQDCPLESNEYKATLTIAAPAHTTYGDGNNAEAAITDASNIKGSATVSYYAATKSGTAYAKTGDALVSAPTAAGDYVAEITLGSATASVGYTIGKAASSITTAPAAADGLTYNGTAQSLVSAGTPNGGTMQYALGANSTTAPASGWGADIPTGTNAGTYYVWYKVVGDADHADSAAACVTVTIGKAAGDEATAVTKADIVRILSDLVEIKGIEGQEYIIVPKDMAPTEEHWRYATLYYAPYNVDLRFVSPDVNLTPITEYDIYTRVAETENAAAGSAAAKMTVMTCLEEMGVTSNDGLTGLVGATYTVETKPAAAEKGVTFQWYHYNGPIEFGTTPDSITEITGATDSAYTLTESDVGKYFGVKAFKNGNEVGAIWLDQPVRYGTVTYDAKGGTPTPDSVSNLKFGDKLTQPANPTRSGYSFAGWYMEEDYKTAWGFASDIVDVTEIPLYAKWSAVPLHTITGTVKDSTGATPQSGVTVTLARGDTVLGKTVTDSSGNFTFSAETGTYNIIAEKGGQTKTELVELTANQSLEIKLPAVGKNSVLDNDNAGTYAPIVGGLDAIANEQNPSVGETITITLRVTEETQIGSTLTAAEKTAFENGKTAIEALPETSGKTVDFLDLKLEKISTTSGTSTTSDIGDSNTQLLTIIIPYATSGKQNVAVYRYHGTEATAMTQNPAPGAEGFVVGTDSITLYAKGFSTYAIGYTTPTYSGGGNSGGSSGSTITVPVSGDSASVSVSASVSGTTATVKAPTTAQLDKVIGESVKTGEVTIDVSGLNKDIATVSIPTETVKAIEKAVSDPNNDADALTVKLTDGSVTFDAAALAAIAQQAKGSTIQLNLDNIGESKLKTAQKTAIKDMDVQAVYDAYMTSNGQRISDFKGGKAAVTVSYTLKDGQTGRGVVVWYVADDGDKSEVPTAYSSKEVTFTVEHFSNYVIAYDAARAAACPKDDTCPISAFSDADPTAWYHDGVHYVLENGIMSGYGNGLFGPGNTTSRAMMAQILWNMEGKPVVNYAMSYTDVDGEAWYTEAVRWVTSEKIMSGYGGGKFGPGDAMTREQLVTIMYRYAQYKGVDVSVGEDTNILSYDDALTVSEFAIPAMQWAVGSGAVSGRTNTTLNPKDTATRAEIATIIMRYCTEIAK